MTEETIEAVEITPLEAPLETPFEIALGTHHHCRSVLVAVHTDSGVTGYGEAAPAPHITGETQETAMAACEAVTDTLRGQPVTDYRGIAALLESTISAQAAARAGIETAVFDALCRSLGCSLSTFLGGRSVPVRTDDTIGLKEPAEAREHARTAAEAGFDELKVKVGPDLDDDVDRVRAVRDGAPHAAIKADANQGYTVSDATAFVDRLSDAGIDLELLEQPVRADDLAGLAQVRSAIDVPVAADEAVCTSADALAVIDRDAADVLNVKLAKSGLLEAVEILEIASAANREGMIGCMVETPVGITAAAHVVAGTDAISYVDLDGHFSLQDERFSISYAPDIDVSGPGIGIEAPASTDSCESTIENF